MNITWKKTRETYSKVGYRKLINKYFIVPDGRETEWNIVDSRSGAAGVFAVTKDGRVVIARQYRPGPERVMDELPGGLIDAGEAPETAAQRELLEETGYRPGNMKLLASIPRDGYVDGTWHYFLATGCEKVQEPESDDFEWIDVTTMTVDEVVASAYAGNMTDVAAVLMAVRALRER